MGYIRYILFVGASLTLSINAADIIIFSYDRPLQLYALLESIEKYVTNVSTIQTIYRASNTDFEVAYTKVFDRFDQVKHYLQSHNPYQDFKKLTIEALQRGTSRYILFAVDDNIVKDHVDLAKCTRFLESTGAYGFYLRLGRNLSYCYPYEKEQPLPPLVHINDEICKWHFNQGSMDWEYQHTVDMAIYRKDDVLKDFRHISFTYPNTLECAWNGVAGHIMNRFGICYVTSKIINIPANRVQKDFHSKSMGISPEELLQIFNENKKIDIEPLHSISNPSAHMAYNFSYITQ